MLPISTQTEPVVSTPRQAGRKRTRAADPVVRASARLKGRLGPGETTDVLVDFVEDDLGEALHQVAEVEAHFAELLELLESGPLSPVTLLEASDDKRVLDRLDSLATLAERLRRQLSRAAGQMGQPRPSAPRAR